MRPVHLVVSALTLSANGIALNQGTAGAGTLILNGAAVRVDDGTARYDVGWAVLDPPRRFTLTSLGNISGTNFTVSGFNRAGTPISETINGPNNNTVTGKLVFARISKVTVDSAVGTSVSIGWGVESQSAPQMLDRFRAPFSIGIITTVVSGGPTYTVEHTSDDIQSLTWNEGTANWLPHASINNVTSSKDGNYGFPVVAIRLRVSAGPGTVNFDFEQAGAP